VATKKFWRGTTPKKCDVCGAHLGASFVDGRIQQGPWAIMCLPCHYDQGVGLGTGRGQRYCSVTMEKVEG
jgi:hypothetical protein